MFQIVLGNNPHFVVAKLEFSIYNFQFTMIKQILNSRKGFIFVEILIAITLITTVFITLLGIGFSSLQISYSIKNSIQADYLAKEELESVRNFRDGITWSNFKTVNFGSQNPYYFTLSNNQWNRNSGTETIGIFTRNVVFDEVSRNPTTKYIEDVYNSLNNDPDTIKVTASVMWNSKTYQVITYFTNWQNK